MVRQVTHWHVCTKCGKPCDIRGATMKPPLSACCSAPVRALEERCARYEAALRAITDADPEALFPIMGGKIAFTDPREADNAMAQRNARFGFKAAQELARAALEDPGAPE